MAETWDAMDAEIRSVFPEKELITRQGARKYPTLEAAVLAGRWPTLAESRGKVLFLRTNKPSAPAYLKGHPLLQGRALLQTLNPANPTPLSWSATRVKQDVIQALVKTGYIVRTARLPIRTRAAKTM